jgi:hypothetical protein
MAYLNWKQTFIINFLSIFVILRTCFLIYEIYLLFSIDAVLFMNSKLHLQLGHKYFYYRSVKVIKALVLLSINIHDGSDRY